MAEHIIYKLGPFRVSKLGQRRHVRVYVPPATASSPRRVLVMFDGQNLFHDEPSYSGGWHLHEAVHALTHAGVPAPLIVGVDHGGADRLHELSPFAAHGSRGRADALLDWLVGSLVPRVRREFGAPGTPAELWVGGSSLGGLAALYAHFRHPDVFGGALCLSPSFWLGRGRIFEYVAARPLPVSRVYLDGGVHEDRDSMAAHVTRMAEHLRGRGYDDARLRLVLDPHGTHSEAAWRRRAPGALRFMQADAAGGRASRAA